MGIREIYSKFRGMIDLLNTFLWIVVIGCAVVIGYSFGVRDFNILISVAGTLVAILAVILIYREMNLKNRPFLYITDFQAEKFDDENKFTFSFHTENCGVLPAIEVAYTTKLEINGRERDIPYSTERSEIYPNQSFFSKCHRGTEYSAGDMIFFTTHIEYEGINKKAYWYESIYEIVLEPGKPDLRTRLIRTVSG